MKTYKVNSVQCFLSISWWFDVLWISEKNVRENAFEKNKNKPGLSVIINRPLNNWPQNWNSLAWRTLGCCKVKTKARLPWKKYSVHFFEASWPWYRQPSDCCWRSISARENSTQTRNIPGDKATAILLSVAPLPALPSPPIKGIFGRLAVFVFLKYENQKTISFRISSALILFPAVSLHMNSFVKFEFLISWNLGKWKLKIHFQLRYQAKISKIKDYRLVFLFLENKKWKPPPGHFQFLIFDFQNIKNCFSILPFIETKIDN